RKLCVKHREGLRRFWGDWQRDCPAVRSREKKGGYFCRGCMERMERWTAGGKQWPFGPEEEEEMRRWLEEKEEKDDEEDEEMSEEEIFLAGWAE
ncbi:MAG: hypothetical protein Q9173_007374, partial [Seirophora scorigena]